MTEYYFFHPIEIRYGDLDPQGHVNNARFLTFFEQTRIEYLIHLGLFNPQQSFLEVGIILADAHITFLAPILFGQDVRVRMRISRLGNKSMTSEYSIIDAASGAELATGSSVLVTYDYRSSATIPVPPDWREKIIQFEKLG